MVQDNINRRAFLRDVNGLDQSLGRIHAASPGRYVLTNGQSLGQSELLDLLRRAMAGDGYPLSGGKDAVSFQDNEAPLTARIRDILQGEPIPAPTPQRHAPFPTERYVEPEQIAVRETRPAPTPTPAPRQTQQAPRAPQPVKAELTAPVWMPSFRSVGFVVLAALVGGSIPALTASSPQYVAETSLRLVGDGSSTPGLLDATAAKLTSGHLLSQAVAKLKLEGEPEFNGGGATAYGVAMDLFTDNGSASDNFSRAQATLRDKLTVARDPQTGTVKLSVRTEDAPQSARIANLMAQIAVGEAALSPAAATSPQASDASRKAYDDASAALADFKAKTGEDKIDAALKLQQQKQAMDGDVARATAAAQAATIRLTAAKAVRLSDVLNGAISPDLGSPATLEDMRNRYAAAKSTLALLATELGPRHPRLLAQQSTVDSLSAGIMAEIQKLVGENDAALKQANEQLKQLKDRAAALNGKTVGVDMTELERLQTAVKAARTNYENDMSMPTVAPRSSLPAPLAIIAPAVAAPVSSDGSVITREMGGVLVGFGIALCLVIGRMLMRHLWRGRTQGEDESMTIARPASASTLPRQPAGEPPHHPVDPPQMRFDVEMPVANDRPAPRQAAQPQPVQRPVDRGVVEARQNVASLRARLETYAAQRPDRR